MSPPITTCAIKSLLNGDWVSTLAIRDRVNTAYGLSLALSEIRALLDELRSRGEIERRAAGNGFEWRVIP